MVSLVKMDGACKTPFCFTGAARLRIAPSTESYTLLDMLGFKLLGYFFVSFPFSDFLINFGNDMCLLWAVYTILIGHTFEFEVSFSHTHFS